MRLSEWRAGGPSKDARSSKVNAVVDPVLTALGAEPDPHVWVAWGEEPASRYAIYAPTTGGLITCFVRVNVPGEGPRASAKLVRWNRVQIGELAIETQGTHRLLSFQVEQQVLNGADAQADQIALFGLGLLAAMDGRPPPAGRARQTRTNAATKGRTKPAAASRAAPNAEVRKEQKGLAPRGRPGSLRR